MCVRACVCVIIIAYINCNALHWFVAKWSHLCYKNIQIDFFQHLIDSLLFFTNGSFNRPKDYYWSPYCSNMQIKIKIKTPSTNNI